MTETAIQFKEVCYEASGHRLLGPLSLSVSQGETLVLLGRSGSGKTTALRLINRLLDPTHGDVFVEGKKTSLWGPVQLRRRVGYVIQDIGLFPHLTVSGNVELVPLLEDWPKHKRRERVAELLELVGLPPEEFSGRRPHELSGGQRQRVGVARALAVDPPIILCDEAFGAVDPITRAALQREFKTLTQKLEKTVVFVTHDVREAFSLADRIVLLDNGTACFDGTVEEFRTSQADEIRALRELE